MLVELNKSGLDTYNQKSTSIKMLYLLSKSYKMVLIDNEDILAINSYLTTLLYQDQDVWFSFQYYFWLVWLWIVL